LGLQWECVIGIVYPFMKQDKHLVLKPSLGTVLLQAAVPAVVGAVLYFKYHHQVASGILCGIGTLMLISGFFIPALFEKIEKVGRWIGKVFGTALTWVLLTPMFYLVFLPGRLILMLQGIDPMCRKFPTDAPTYWVARKPVSDVNEYKRQF